MSRTDMFRLQLGNKWFYVGCFIGLVVGHLIARWLWM